MSQEQFSFIEYNQIKEVGDENLLMQYLNDSLKVSRGNVIEEYLLGEKIQLLMKCDNSDLLEVTENAIKKYPNSPPLLYYYAQVLNKILLETDQNNTKLVLSMLDDVENAFKNAETHFNVRRYIVMRDGLNEEKIDLPSIFSNLDVFLDKKIEIYSKIHDVQLLRLNYNLYLSNIQQNQNIMKIEKVFEDSRIKHFEMLGLFAAIIALIVSNVSAFDKLSFEEIILTNIFVVISFLILLVFSSKMIGLSSDAERKNQLMGILLFLVFVFCFLIYFT